MKLAIVGTTFQFFNVHKSHGFFFFFFCINEICQNATCQLPLNFCPHKTEQYFEFQSKGGSHPQFTCESKK